MVRDIVTYIDELKQARDALDEAIQRLEHDSDELSVAYDHLDEERKLINLERLAKFDEYTSGASRVVSKNLEACPICNGTEYYTPGNSECEACGRADPGGYHRRQI